MSQNTSEIGVAEPGLVEASLDDRKAKLSDFGLFFRKFLAKGRTISSAIPSSRAMAECVLETVDFCRPATIVELGAGTGPVTQEIIQRMQPHHRLIIVENDPDFCEVLRRRFPETTLIEGDASRVGQALARLGIPHVDYVISGLPTPNLPIKSKVSLWRWLAEALSPSGQFIQITVAPMIYRKFYTRLFERVRYRMVWMNFPPGGVYRCSRPRRHLFKTNGKP